VRVMEGREGACELSGSHGKSHKVINGVSEVAACTTTCMTWNMTWNLTWYMYTTFFFFLLAARSTCSDER
jgi:hypothetical protein